MPHFSAPLRPRNPTPAASLLLRCCWPVVRVMFRWIFDGSSTVLRWIFEGFRCFLTLKAGSRHAETVACDQPNLERHRSRRNVPGGFAQEKLREGNFG